MSIKSDRSEHDRDLHSLQNFRPQIPPFFLTFFCIQLVFPYLILTRPKIFPISCVIQQQFPPPPPKKKSLASDMDLAKLTATMVSAALPLLLWAAWVGAAPPDGIHYRSPEEEDAVGPIFFKWW